ncbi:A24 family peptidase [Sphingopyxis solisilvae]|uniref:A24 family peptidase n=1 Tax=Sphingopyxis solisilvae TaxID=1886788 RepID=UPI00226BD29E|nr:prepilin peptidase [Sphingopyxis solisilvae]
MPAIELAFAAILLAAAVSDARRFLIPNFYPLCLLLLAALAWVAGFPFSGPLWSHLLHFVAALTVGMLMFHFGWFGGGDVKLYAAVALWFDFSEGLTLLLFTSLAGVGVVVLSLALLMLRTSIGGAPNKQGRLRDRRIAYGVAIAAGGISSLLWTYS